MLLLFYSLAQAHQPQRLPWGFLVLFGLMAVVAVGLLIYFMTRVRKSEKEAEDDWGLSGRGILLTPPASEPPVTKKKIEVPLEERPPLKEPEAAVIATPEPPKPTLGVETLSKPEPEMTAESPAPAVSLDAADTTPPEPVQVVAELHQGPVAEPPAQVHPALEHVEQPSSPFDQEVWSQLESPQPSAVTTDSHSASPAATVTSQREPYEPPRIDPILPRKDQAQKADLLGPHISNPASASAHPPASRARLEVRSPTREGAKKSAAVAAGSILGLPAEASAGPFIIDRSRARAAAAEVGTLANYDKPPDDTAGHSGTIALIIVLVLVLGSLAAYFALPPVHSTIDKWVAHVRGIDTSEPPKVVVQIFPAPYDNTKDPIQVKGSLQNISDQSLYGLVVTVSLQPRPGGDQATEYAQVSPDELPPNQQGSYEFQIDGKKYLGYKIVGLKNKDGVTFGYVRPNQTQ